MRVQGNTLLGSSANKIKDKLKMFDLFACICICMQVPVLPGVWEDPAVLRFEKLLLDEVLLV